MQREISLFDDSVISLDNAKASDSPFHESNSSLTLSPREINEQDHDADSDNSSADERDLAFDSSKVRDSNKKKAKRRTSSNVFNFKSTVEEYGSLTEVDLLGDNVLQHDFQHHENTHQTFRKMPSFSSSNDEDEKNSTSIGKAGRMESISTTSSEETSSETLTKKRRNNAVDGLLFEIYDRFQRRDSQGIDSDMTECSTTSVTSIYVASSFENDDRPKLDRNYLESKEVAELEKMVRELRRGVNMLNSKLVKLLKQRDRNAHKIQENFNVLTALLQAVSQKRRVDTRIRFSFIPRPGKRGFRQWIDAVKAVARIESGIPAAWRKRTWLSLAEFFLKDVEWEKLKKLCFNDRKNPDDDELDTQIVKDLHRTGCGWFFEHDSEEDRASLKRVLLGYARWNKSIGYCQGFNVIAALILQVMEGNEEDALKVMIFLVDYVLPKNYFANNLRALSVDMAVLRDLMGLKLPKLAQLLHQLQKDAMDTRQNASASYEPPLINMFTMQWFLTLFATCLPRNTVLRIWDSVLLEGSEVLLRVALALWGKLGSYFDNLYSASDFYVTMGKLIQDMMLDEFINVDKLIETVYQISSFPWSTISDLREKYTYDIHPFSTFNADKKLEKKIIQQKPVSEDEDIVDSEDEKMIGCLGFVGAHYSNNEHTSSIKNAKSNNEKVKGSQTQSKTDITKVTPGAYITDQDAQSAYEAQVRRKEIIRETEKLDLGKLKNQYGRMRRLQQKAMLVFSANDFKDNTYRSENPPSAINHLFVDVSKVAPPRTKYRRSTSFPALKAPSKNVTPTLKPLKERKVVYEENNGNINIFSTHQKNNEQINTENVTLQNPYIANEVQTLPDQLEQCSMEESVKITLNKSDPPPSSKTEKHKRHKSPSKSKSKDNSKTDTELKSTSLLYQVDKSALYPTNFKPFPHRNPKRKPLVAK